MWEQKWLEFDQGMGSTGLDRIEIAKRSNIKESIVSRVLWYLEKTNLVDVGNYEDVLPQKQPCWITPLGIEHYENHRDRWANRIWSIGKWFLTIFVTAIVTALAMKYYGPTDASRDTVNQNQTVQSHTRNHSSNGLDKNTQDPMHHEQQPNSTHSDSSKK